MPSETWWLGREPPPTSSLIAASGWTQRWVFNIYARDGWIRPKVGSRCVTRRRGIATCLRLFSLTITPLPRHCRSAIPVVTTLLCKTSRSHPVSLELSRDYPRQLLCIIVARPLARPCWKEWRSAGLFSSPPTMAFPLCCMA